MSDFVLTRTQIRGGVYQGVLKRNGRIRREPQLELRLLDADLGTLNLTPDPEQSSTWNVMARIPTSAITEGIQTFILRDPVSGETLDSFAIISGNPVEEDLRAEMALLRAELEMLKRAFRQQGAKPKS